MEGFRIKNKEHFLNEIVKCSEVKLLNAVALKESAYFKREKNKKDGKRIFYSIERTHSLYNIQKNLQINFFENFLFPECVCGFRKRRSYYDFLIPHVNENQNSNYLRLDISDFFGSIRIKDIEKALKYYFVEDIEEEEKEWITERLLEIITYDEKVVQGAVTSPTISNLVFRSLDIRIEKYCKKMGIVYTRYADDMLFSSRSSYVHNYKFTNMIKEIIGSKGLSINHRKTLKFKNEISISGYVVGKDIRLSRKKFKVLNEIIYNINKDSFEGSSQDKLYKTKNELAGYRAFLIQALKYEDTKNKEKLRKKIAQIELLINEYCIRV